MDTPSIKFLFQTKEYDEWGFYKEPLIKFRAVQLGYERAFNKRFPNCYANVIMAHSSTLAHIEKCLLFEDGKKESSYQHGSPFFLDEALYALASQLPENYGEPILIMSNDKVKEHELILKYYEEDPEVEKDEMDFASLFWC